MPKAFLRRLILPLLVLALLATFTGIASAQSTGPTTDDLATALNVMWMLIAGFLVFFMQAGFALVETGFTRAEKRGSHHDDEHDGVLHRRGRLLAGGLRLPVRRRELHVPGDRRLGRMGLLADDARPVGRTLNSWLIRFGQIGILGGSGFMLNGLGAVSGILAFFLFQMVFMDTAATIPTGAMAERLKFIGFVLMGLWVSMFIYPLVGNWVWGGGWLANLGRIAGLGNGVGGLRRIGCGAHDRRQRCARRGPRARPTHRSLQQGRLGQCDAGAQHPDGHSRHHHPVLRLVRVQSGSSLAFVGGGQFLAVNAAVNTLLAGAAGGGCGHALYVADRPLEEARSRPVGKRRPGGSGGNHRALCVRNQRVGGLDRSGLRCYRVPRDLRAGKGARR